MSGLTQTETELWDKIHGIIRDYDGHAFSPYGDTEADVMLVAIHPSYGDLDAGKLFGSDKDQDLLSGIFKKYKLDLDTNFWVTSFVKSMPKAGKKATAKEIKYWRECFEHEIELVKPKLIIAFGAEAWKAVLHKAWKISQFQGDIIPCDYGLLMGTHNTFTVHTLDPKVLPDFELHMKTALDFAVKGKEYTPFEHIYVDDPEVLKNIVDYYLTNDRFQDIGYDAEWLPTNPNEEIVYTFQFSMDAHKAVVVNISEDGVTENQLMWDALKPLLEHPKIRQMGWNIRADIKRLITRGIKPLDETLAFDGMKACQFFDNRWPKGLDTGIRRFTNYEPYYVEFYLALKKHKIEPQNLVLLREKEPEIYHRYCAGDAVAHLTACRNMMHNLKKMPQKLQDNYFDVFLPLTTYLTDMEISGMPVDIALMDQMTNQYQKLFDKISGELTAVAVAEGLKKYKPHYWGDKNKLFFDKLQLRPGFYKHKKKTKPRAWYEKQKKKTQKICKPSSDNKSLETIYFDLLNGEQTEEVLRKLAIVQLQLDFNRINAVLNKFLAKKGIDEALWDASSDIFEESEDGVEPLKQSYWSALTKHKRLHTDFFECLQNFRCSSTPNTQNAANKVFPKIKDVFKRHFADQPEKQQINSIREIFYAGGKDWCVTEADVSGADIAIMANLAQDEIFQKEIRSGNFHLLRARDYFRDPTLDKSKNVDLYTIGKNITFRISYTGELSSAAIPIQADIYAEQGRLVDLDTLQYALQTWTKYKKYMVFRKNCMDSVREHGILMSPRGIPFRFGECDDMGVLSGWLNESLALNVSSELALLMHEIGCKLRNRFIKDKVWNKWIFGYNYIHDAHYFRNHIDLLKDNYLPEVLKEYFCHNTPMVTGDYLGVEVSVRDRWKGSIKHFEKETTWNEKTKTWEW